MRILIIATFIIFMANTFVNADVGSSSDSGFAKLSEKVIFCKSDSEHLALVNIFALKEAPAVLAETHEINRQRVYVLTARDVGSNLIVRGDNELINPAVNFDYKESDKKFTVVISKNALNEYQKKPFFVTVSYDSGQEIDIYCKAAVKPKN